MLIAHCRAYVGVAHGLHHRSQVLRLGIKIGSIGVARAVEHQAIRPPFPKRANAWVRALGLRCSPGLRLDGNTQPSLPFPQRTLELPICYRLAATVRGGGGRRRIGRRHTWARGLRPGCRGGSARNRPTAGCSASRSLKSSSGAPGEIRGMGSLIQSRENWVSGMPPWYDH